MPAKRGTLTQRVESLEKRFDVHEEFLGNGLSKKVAAILAPLIVKAMQADHDALMFIKGKLEGMKDPAPPPSSQKHITLRQAIEIGVVALVAVGILGAIVLFAVGKMTADDAAKIIAALRGGK